MTAHAIGDALLISAAVGEMAVLYWLLGQKSYWKRFARIMENRMLDARERAGTAERALGALRRALDRLEAEYPANDTDDTA